MDGPCNPGEVTLFSSKSAFFWGGGGLEAPKSRNLFLKKKTGVPLAMHAPPPPPVPSCAKHFFLCSSSSSSRIFLFSQWPRSGNENRGCPLPIVAFCIYISEYCCSPGRVSYFRKKKFPHTELGVTDLELLVSSDISKLNASCLSSFV